MTEEKKVPDLRFPGFTDPWEQRKFGSLLEETRNKTTVEDEDTLLSCAIDGMYLNSELFSHFRGSSNIGYLKIKKNDLILSAQNLHLGNCNVNLRFEHGIISPAYKVYELVGCNPLFMQAWVKKDSTKDFFLKASTEGASVCRKNIVWEELYKQELPIPKIEEQTKVGEYFNSLDHLITLHQRKVDDLKTMKTCLLQKMFPKEGENTPELRFPGFTDPWEQRKLGDIVDFLDTQRKPLTENVRKKGPYPYYGASGIVDYVAGYLFDEELILLSEDGANITDRNYPVCFLASGKYWVNNHAHVLRAKPEMDNNFICNAMEKKDYSNYNTGMAMPKLNQDTCKQIPVDCPSYAEQKKIGDFFRDLDKTITLHQRKVDDLKTMKKCLLQKMFI